MKLKWNPAPVKTQWGDDMVVASVAIDKDNTVDLYCERSQTVKVETMFTSPQPAQQQEPVAQEWRYYFSHSGATGKPDEVVGPCFTDRKEVAFGVGCFDQTALCPPASKPWVGLTDEERMDVLLALNWNKQLTHMDTANAIEAKLREKNA